MGYVAFVDVSSVHNPCGHGDVICVGVFVFSVEDILAPISHTHTPITAFPNFHPTPSTAHSLHVYYEERWNFYVNVVLFILYTVQYYLLKYGVLIRIQIGLSHIISHAILQAGLIIEGRGWGNYNYTAWQNRMEILQHGIWAHYMNSKLLYFVTCKFTKWIESPRGIMWKEVGTSGPSVKNIKVLLPLCFRFWRCGQVCWRTYQCTVKVIDLYRKVCRWMGLLVNGLSFCLHRITWQSVQHETSGDCSRF